MKWWELRGVNELHLLHEIPLSSHRFSSITHPTTNGWLRKSSSLFILLPTSSLYNRSPKNKVQLNAEVCTSRESGEGRMLSPTTLHSLDPLWWIISPIQLSPSSFYVDLNLFLGNYSWFQSSLSRGYKFRSGMGWGMRYRSRRRKQQLGKECRESERVRRDYFPTVLSFVKNVWAFSLIQRDLHIFFDGSKEF
jgi:hypothetical protein